MLLNMPWGPAVRPCRGALHWLEADRVEHLQVPANGSFAHTYMDTICLVKACDTNTNLAQQHHDDQESATTPLGVPKQQLPNT